MGNAEEFKLNTNGISPTTTTKKVYPKNNLSEEKTVHILFDYHKNKTHFLHCNKK